MSWSSHKLGEYCEVIAGQSPEGKYYNDSGDGLPFYQGKKEFGDRYIGAPQKWTTKVTKEAKAGDILMSVRAPVGPINFSTEHICIGRGLAAIRPSDKLDRDFLFYYLLSKQDEIQGSEGAVFASINKSQIESLSLLYVGLEDQKRIVAILDQAFADIDKARALTEQNLKNARELFESYLQQVFSQRGEGWVIEPLGNLVTNDCTLSYGIVQPGNDFVDGLHVVRPTDLTKEVIGLSGLKRIDPSKAEGYTRTMLQGGELLLCVRGSTGTTSIASENLAGANVTRGIVPIRFNPEKVSQRFGYYQFSSPLIQAQIKAGTYGAALMQINIRDLRKIEVAVPPLSVQSELVNKLDSVKPDLLKVEALYLSKLDAFDQLKKSLLQKAFSGELTNSSAEAAA